MNHVEQARLWATKFQNRETWAEGWESIRSAVVTAPPSELPDVVAAVNWLVEIECHANPEAQRAIDQWLQMELETGDAGPPKRLVELRTQRERLAQTRPPDPSNAESKRLTEEAKTFTEQLDKLKRCLTTIEGGKGGTQ